MGWMDRLRGAGRPTEATPARIAESVAVVVTQRADHLMAELRQARPPQNEASFMMECLIFSAFPFDVIICAEFGPHADAIRTKLREQLFRALQAVIEALPMEMFPEFADHFQETTTNYVKVWTSATGGPGLERLGRAAGQAIRGPGVTLGMTEILTCSALAQEAFASFKGLSSKYKVVTP